MKAIVSTCAVVAVLCASVAPAAAAQAAAAKTDATAKPAAPTQAAKPAPAAPRPAASPAGTAPTGAPPQGGAAAPAALTASPVVFPYVRLTAKDLDAAKKFWVDTIGGTSAKAGSADAVKFPNAMVVLQKGEPKGGSKGSVLDHVTFDVKDVKALVEKIKKAGGTMATRAETNSVYVVTDDVAFLPDQATSVAVVMAPDNVKVELREAKQATSPIALRSVHFAAPQVAPMKEWYVKGLGAKIGNRGFGFESLDLGKQTGLLMFTLANDKVEATDGRAAGLGFEVRGAALLAKKLEKLGAKITRPYGKSPDTGAMSVVVTDPWGTAIELSEGLKL